MNARKQERVLYLIIVFILNTSDVSTAYELFTILYSLTRIGLKALLLEIKSYFLQ